MKYWTIIKLSDRWVVQAMEDVEAMTKPWLKSFIYFVLQVTSCKLYKKGQICRFGATWLVEMREPVFDLIKEGEPESGHLVKSDTRTTVLFHQTFSTTFGLRLKWKWTQNNTSDPQGWCSSPDLPSCPQQGNSQIGGEPEFGPNNQSSNQCN